MQTETIVDTTSFARVACKCIHFQNHKSHMRVINIHEYLREQKNCYCLSTVLPCIFMFSGIAENPLVREKTQSWMKIG